MLNKIIAKNDLYFMEVVGNKIVINDNYEGILIYDLKLNLINKIKLFEDIVIYSSFVNGKNKIILFCPENEGLVYINIENKNWEFIPFKDEISDIIIKELYSSSEERYVFITTDNEFIEVSLIKKSAFKLDKNLINKNHLQIHINEKKPKIEKDKIMDKDYVNITIFEKITGVVYENRIELYNNDIKIIMQPQKNYIFNNLKIVKHNNQYFLIILSNDKGDKEISLITILKLNEYCRLNQKNNS